MVVCCSGRVFWWTLWVVFSGLCSWFWAGARTHAATSPPPTACHCHTCHRPSARLPTCLLHLPPTRACHHPTACHPSPHCLHLAASATLHPTAQHALPYTLPRTWRRCAWLTRRVSPIRRRFTYHCLATTCLRTANMAACGVPPLPLIIRHGGVLVERFGTIIYCLVQTFQTWIWCTRGRDSSFCRAYTAPCPHAAPHAQRRRGAVPCHSHSTHPRLQCQTDRWRSEQGVDVVDKRWALRYSRVGVLHACVAFLRLLWTCRALQPTNCSSPYVRRSAAATLLIRRTLTTAHACPVLLFAFSH